VRPEVVRDWVEVLRQLIVENGIPDELWDSVWRDYSCLDGRARGDLQELIWSRVPRPVSVAYVASAFTEAWCCMDI
jgi:hypothetical protein